MTPFESLEADQELPRSTVLFGIVRELYWQVQELKARITELEKHDDVENIRQEGSS